jgi:carbon-monoxide dehydrogenase medium subunit
MKNFDYFKPQDFAEACELVSRYREEAKIIAGGQSLVPMIRTNLIAPSYVIDIKELKALEYIVDGADSIRIGAVVTHNDLQSSPLIKARYPILIEMEQRLASSQIRNWGTLGGNICHADPAGDLAPCLIGLQGRVRVRSASKTRVIALNDFFVDYLQSVLEPDEILTEIEIPHQLPNTGGAFIKESVTAGSIAIVSAAAVLSLNGDEVKHARIVLGAVGPTPVRAYNAEKALTENRSIEEVSMIAAEDARPTEDIRGSVEFKRNLVKVATKYALTEAIRRAKCLDLKPEEANK